jgi:predicted kinase
VVLVGGLPGAGKSTAIQRATAGRTDVDVIDSDTVRRWLRSRLPNGLPYGRFRWLVHTVTVIWMAVALVRGPRFGRRLVVHDPSTRPRRRRAFAGLARLRRWSPVLMLVDVSRAEALQGQRDRHRIVRPAAFDRHWTRWQQLRQLALARPTAIDDGRWSLSAWSTAPMRRRPWPGSSFHDAGQGWSATTAGRPHRRRPTGKGRCPARDLTASTASATSPLRRPGGVPGLADADLSQAGAVQVDHPHLEVVVARRIDPVGQEGDLLAVR